MQLFHFSNDQKFSKSGANLLLKSEAASNVLTNITQCKSRFGSCVSL